MPDPILPEHVLTARDATVDPKGSVISYTLERLGADETTRIPVPMAARNIRSSLKNGRLVVTYDVPNGYDVEGNKTTDDPTDEPSYSVGCSTSQEPLATHKHFQPGGKWEISEAEWKLWKKWQDSGTPLDQAPASVELEAASEGLKKFVKKYTAGTTDYLCARVTIRVTTPDSGRPDVSMVGKIADPGVSVAGTTDINFIITDMDDQPEGQTNARHRTVTYMSSGPRAWDPELYEDA